MKKKPKISGGGVKLLGNRNDVYRVYQAMDVFVFPSRVEGLGIAAIEAQMCGVRTIVSQNIIMEAKISENTKSLNLSDSIEEWVTVVMSASDSNKIMSDAYEIYDISIQAQKLTSYYGGVTDDTAERKREAQFAG